jgi:glucan phosphoethanolaminetransferase (alkaline phosphatase superfamily)
MTKFIQKTIAVFLALLLLNAQMYAAPFSTLGNSDDVNTVVNFDENEVYAEFSAIADLSDMIASSELTADEIATTDASILENVSTLATLPLTSDEESGGAPLGIPSFLWGCLFGILGIVLVYFISDENKDETKKAVWGCVASSAVSIIVWIIWAAAVSSAAATTSTGYYY